MLHGDFDTDHEGVVVIDANILQLKSRTLTLSAATANEVWFIVMMSAMAVTIMM